MRRAFTSMLIGNAAATDAGLDMALQLSPLDPLLYGFHGVRAQMLIQNGRFPDCGRAGPTGLRPLRARIT